VKRGPYRRRATDEDAIRAVKLIDEEGLTFTDAAERLGLCRRTLTRIYKRKKEEMKCQGKE